jgi:hypothetical protein
MDSQHRASGSRTKDDPLYAPGLKRRARKDSEAVYWVPPARDVAAGWPLKTMTLSGSELAIAEKCRVLWDDLERWRKGLDTGAAEYSISWLIKRYQSDPLSPYRTKIKEYTRDHYDHNFRIIDATIGGRIVAAKIQNGTVVQRITGEDVLRWHHQWGLPDESGIATAPARARHCIESLRVLLSYAIVVGVPGARDLREGLLKVLRFPTIKARTSAPTREQVLAIVNAALQWRYDGKVKNEKRADALQQGWLSIAITTLAQFELTERRTHIIGYWENRPVRRWIGGWTWANISPDWRIRYTQNKCGVVQREFDLKDTPLLLELLQRIPLEQRWGAVIKCDTTGKPWRSRYYARCFREIATAAGVPDDIWSMDMRAGGAVEADSIEGLTMKDMQAAGGWATEGMVRRYSRGGTRAAQNVVRLRQQAAAKPKD